MTDKQLATLANRYAGLWRLMGGAGAWGDGGDGKAAEAERATLRAAICEELQRRGGEFDDGRILLILSDAPGWFVLFRYGDKDFDPSANRAGTQRFNNAAHVATLRAFHANRKAQAVRA